MKVELVKITQNDHHECAGRFCKKPSEYMMFNGFGYGMPPWSIKTGVTAVSITCYSSNWTYDRDLNYKGSDEYKPQIFKEHGVGTTEYYCPGCFKFILDKLRSFLDPNLWVFH